MPTRSFDQFLAELEDQATVGLNAYVGVELDTRCGWVFGGYAMPLLDPIENHAREMAETDACPSAWEWTPYLDWHVDTTSTSSVFVRANERWRIYVQSPYLRDDVAGASSSPTLTW